MPTHAGANIEFGKDYTRICVGNIEDLPAVVNIVVDAKRRMHSDEVMFAKAKASAESWTSPRERQGIDNTDTGRLHEEREASASSKRRKRNHDHGIDSTKRQGTIASKRIDSHLLLEANDPLRSLGWKTVDCGMWDQTKGEFPDACFMKNSCLGEQCPRSDVFHLLPEIYSMGDGWTYKYAKCGCASNKSAYSAVTRLILPARQDDTDLKCYFIQVATEDLEQHYCQHEGEDGGAHIVPGGEFAMERLREQNHQ